MFSFPDNPIQAFEAEFQKASEAGILDPQAMTLATVSQSGAPSARIVLFKGMVRNGFSFYTNYESQKGQELTGNPHVALLFFWPQLEEQIRIDGRVEKLSRSESEAYFRTRPRMSQLGAWTSEQSREISSFDVLDHKLQDLEKKYEGQEVPCPPHWGGFLVKPMQMEFWFGRPGRLHERYVYTLVSPEGRAMRADDLTSAVWRKTLKSP